MGLFGGGKKDTRPVDEGLAQLRGSDENTLGARWRRYRSERARYDARQRLRARVRRGGQSVVAALIERGDAVYRLEPGPHAHRLVGVSAGSAGGIGV